MFGFWRRPTQPPSPPSLPGWERLQQQLGPDFHLQRQLNQGTLFLAHARATDRAVLIRCYSHLREAAALSFQRQIEVLTQLRHPGLATVLAGGVGEYAWLARDWLEGQPLDQHPQGSPLELLWLRQLSETLQYLHRQGLVSGPLKPRDLWWIEPQLVLSEYHTLSSIPNDHCVAGPDLMPSPCGLAPEQVAGASPSPATDAFSLGCLAYQLLSGQPIFPETDIMQFLMKLLNQQPPPLSQLRPDLSEALCQQVMALLSKDPSQRPSLGDLFRCPHLNLTTPSGPEVRQVLDRLQSEGEPEKTRATFTIDPRQALQKLKNFQFPHYEMCLLALCAAAQSLQCKLAVQWQRGGLRLTYQDFQLSASQLQELWAHALASPAGALTHLARGLAGALSPPGSRIKVSSAGQGFSLQNLDQPRLQPTAAGDLEIEIQGPALSGLNLQSVARHFRYAQVEIQWQGLPQNLRRIPPSHPLQHQGKILQLAIDLLAPPEFCLVVDGIAFELPPFEFGKVLVWSQHPLDLSYQNPVDPPQLQQLREFLQAHLDQAVVQEVEKIAEIGPREIPLMRRAWQLTTVREGWVNTVLESLRRNPDSSPELVALAVTGLRHIQSQSQKPALYWSSLARPAILTHWQPDWLELVQIAEHNFSQPTERIDWLLQVCLSHKILQPQPHQLLALLASIPLDTPQLIRNHDLLLAEYLGPNPEVDPQTWLDILPQSWLYTRARLQGQTPSLLDRTRAVFHRYPPTPGK